MRLCDFCFVSAALAALIGMSLGIQMGMAEDFTLSPAHAHLNLLGWVTMALMGLYYRGSAAAHWRLARVQVALGATGFWVMPLGLGVYLGTGDTSFVPVVIAGSVLALLAMLLFAAIVVTEVRARAVPPLVLHPHSG